MIHCYILLTSSSHIVVQPFSFNLPCMITLFTMSIHCVTYNRIHINKRLHSRTVCANHTGYQQQMAVFLLPHIHFRKGCVLRLKPTAPANTYLRWNFQICLFKTHHCCFLRLKVAAKNSGRFCLPLAQTILIGSRFLWRHTGFHSYSWLGCIKPRSPDYNKGMFIVWMLSYI